MTTVPPFQSCLRIRRDKLWETLLTHLAHNKGSKLLVKCVLLLSVALDEVLVGFLLAGKAEEGWHTACHRTLWQWELPARTPRPRSSHLSRTRNRERIPSQLYTKLYTKSAIHLKASPQQTSSSSWALPHKGSTVSLNSAASSVDQVFTHVTCGGHLTPKRE